MTGADAGTRQLPAAKPGDAWHVRAPILRFAQPALPWGPLQAIVAWVGGII